MSSVGHDLTLNATLAAIWDRNRPAMLSRADDVLEGVRAVRAGSLDDELRYVAERAVHQLTGTLGMFGLARGTDIAREIEAGLHGDGTVPLEHLAGLADELHAIVERGPDHSVAAAPAATQLLRAAVKRRTRLLVVSPDPDLCGRLEDAGERRGLRVSLAPNAVQARLWIRSQTPDAVILELSDDETEAAGALQLITELDSLDPAVPVMVLAASDELSDRVEAARHGARGFFHPLTDPERILDAAQRELSASTAPEPARVLAVDDDPMILEVLGPLLSPLGVAVTVVDDPLLFWDALDEKAPDLVILDVDMPEVDGIGLCRAIRNDLRYSDLPVLFLTAHTDPESIQRLYSVGADDYVAKPIVGPELTTRIANRLERARLARRLADTDGLTGIATRRKGEDVLARFMRMADRYDQPVTLAVLDVDHFKAVNDRFGHATGDTVLRALARHLQDAFRGEDVVARWGGEEFVVGMYGMHRDGGVSRIERLLASFVEVDLGPGVAPITFSAGIAGYPQDGACMDAVYRAADGALYNAKAQGRNRVLLAEDAPAPAIEPVVVGEAA